MLAKSTPVCVALAMRLGDYRRFEIGAEQSPPAIGPFDAQERTLPRPSQPRSFGCRKLKGFVTREESPTPGRKVDVPGVMGRKQGDVEDDHERRGR